MFLNRKQRRAMKAKGATMPDRSTSGTSSEQMPVSGRIVEMKMGIPEDEIPAISIMIVGTKSGKCLVGHTEGQLHLAHSLCVNGAQTLYQMLLRQVVNQENKRIVPVPTPLTNIILPPLSGRDA